MTGKVLVFGDSMLDGYLYSECRRVSPEAPVPILNFVAKEYRLGGVANVALGIKALGAEPYLVSAIGKDDNAVEMNRMLYDQAIESGNITLAGYETIYKERIIAQNQQIARIDYEGKLPEQAARLLVDNAIEILQKDDGDIQVLVVSDYNKGACIYLPDLLLEAKKKNIATFVDPKITDLSRYRDAFLIKPNLSEFRAFFPNTEIDPMDDDQMRDLASSILHEYNIDFIVVTMGKNGFFALDKNGYCVRGAAKPSEVFDVSGAGDTFLSCLVAEYIKGKTVYDAATIANYASAIAVGKFGTSPVYADELESILISQGVLSVDPLEMLNRYKRSGKRVVFTNGCFDVLHLGHLHLLTEAKKHGDILVVGINADQSVQSLKGSSRPINKLIDRVQMLESIAPVDMVISFEESTPEILIKKIMPDVLIKGADYAISEIVGAEFVQSYGGKVQTVSLVKGKSSTAIIKAGKA